MVLRVASSQKGKCSNPLESEFLAHSNRFVIQIIGNKSHLLPFYRFHSFVQILKITMAGNKLRITDLRDRFSNLEAIQARDIYEFYRQFEPQIKHSTVNWRVYHLVQTGILSRIGRGRFILGNKTAFAPILTPTLRKVYGKLHNRFPFVQMCLWHTSVLNKLMVHQPGRFHTMVEVDKEAAESVFYFLRDQDRNVFFKPGAEVLDQYVSLETETTVRQLVSEAPIQFIDNTPTITIEKLLVDVFLDKILFSAQQGSELKVIFKNALEMFPVNENTMLRYANRRGRKKAFQVYLNQASSFKRQETD